MKFTKKQGKDILNRHMGGGTIAIRTGEREYSYCDIWLDNHGEFRIVNSQRISQKLSDWLREQALEMKTRGWIDGNKI